MRGRAYDPVKRLLDLVGAVALLLVLSPVLLGIAFVVLLALGPPAIFRQPRPGKHEKVFTLYKFRTMKAAPEGAGDVEAVSSDETRLTPLGRFLRKTSLDELPQLVNVLKGDMSFIGPRPLLVGYLGHYTPEQERRHDVRPGITGWAQVNGRNAASWEDRLAMDAYYARNYSLALDARIALGTVGAVFSARGVSADGQATVEPLTARLSEGDAPDGTEEGPETR